ncbi:hypothetical protein HN371_10140 [Candidatus Poribacteria bacterium]|jgi:hypothetical protein|nr:hypothetical protein [Candidatus Poribacteria bacterium]MBT5714527.1 hypothetical protein [Candidatus Poribacteria bacterium]MBT7101612.1 hypothetical protein [Candidatus Poribacteria bacterium]MBT7807269.1 hypothetical protein [Candidatus Poribacteria bacterium]
MEWNAENYGQSHTNSAWACTPYSAGWDGSSEHGEDLPASDELRAIFDEEMAMGQPPTWSLDVIRRMIDPMSMCGHAMFPAPANQIVQAIGAEACPEFVLGCYTAPPDRKRRMLVVVYCLDAWSQEAPLAAAQAELESRRDDLGIDWASVLASVYAALGERSEVKVLLAEHLISRLRWWVKTLTWFDDKRDVFQLDVYGGDVRGAGDDYGNPPFGDPYFAQLQLPRTQKRSARLRELLPEAVASKLIDAIESTWLCAPKVFRYVERLIHDIGAVEADAPPAAYPAILESGDSYPDFDDAKAWYERLVADLTAWLDGDADAVPALGQVTPAKHWLTRLLRHKLELYVRHCSFGNLVAGAGSGANGLLPLAVNDRSVDAPHLARA